MNEFDPETESGYYPAAQPPAAKKYLMRALPQNKIYINVILFILTALSTYVTGGFWFAVAILSILLSHEMGHYLMCRRYGVQATLPFFIPFPFGNPFGTMGAVIQMRGWIPSRKALFDIGAAGPLAGLLITIPALYFGISLSQIVDTGTLAKDSFSLGESLAFKGMSWLALGAVPEGKDILLHPVAYAGWAGLFVTALNLLPIGQLDGGHVVYSILGSKAKYFTYVFLAAMAVLTWIYNGWGLLFLLLLFFGRRHPAPYDDETPLDAKRIVLGIAIFAIFLLSFTPIPFKI
jgi:membrane-associated protease RseP (regulator of RpoE activity)